MPFVRRRLPAALLLPLTLAATTRLAAQHGGHASAPAAADSTMPLYREALGSYGWKVATASADAQAYFDQGVQFMYAFAPDEATRSFREAQRRDAACAMCAWGEAWSLGAYLNERMSDADAPAADAAARRAERLAARNGSALERDLARAMRARYAAKQDSVARLRLDSAYARAMGGVHARHPESLEAATLYAEALMLLEPRRGTWPIERLSVRRIHEVLAGVLAKDVTHPGACHLYIHATETTPKAGDAQACADRLGLAIPGASHLNHMPSHTYNRVGRWGDAVKANQQAWHSDQKAAVGEGFAIYPTHNLHMLLFAASMDGQGAVATQAAKDLAKLAPNHNALSLHALVLLRFGRFDEVLALEGTPSNPVHRGLLAFARGYAHLRAGRADSARAVAALVDSLAAHVPDSVTFRGHTAAKLLGATGGILRGELLRHAGDTAQGIAALERAVALEDSLVYDEPEPLPFSARHWLGAALLESGRAAEAERVYREALTDHPNNGWSLFGLAKALRAQGKADEAAKAQADFDRAWARADTWMRASRF